MTDAVTTEPLRPKLTPFELENVSAETLLLVVPAEMLMLACVEATVAVAVMTPALRPKETLLELE